MTSPGMVPVVSIIDPALTEARTTIRFVTPFPGFAEARTADLAPLAADDDTFFVMAFTEEPVEFLVARPERFFPDYAPVVDDDTASRVGITEADQALLLVIVTTRTGPTDATANLFAPVLVNTGTGAAVQAVLHDSNYDLRALLASGIASSTP